MCVYVYADSGITSGPRGQTTIACKQHSDFGIFVFAFPYLLSLACLLACLPYLTLPYLTLPYLALPCLLRTRADSLRTTRVRLRVCVRVRERVCVYVCAPFLSKQHTKLYA